MQTGAESPPDVCHVAVVVSRREQPEAVDHQHLCTVDTTFAALQLREHHHPTPEAATQRIETHLIKLMRSDDESHLRMVVKPWGIHIFVSLPTAAHHHHRRGTLLAMSSKCLKFSHITAGSTNRRHPVEACVATHLYPIHTDTSQKPAAILILHEDAAEPPEPFAVRGARMADAVLIITEDGADKIGGDVAAMQLAEVIAPDFILHEDSHLRLDQVEETLHPPGGVEGEIADAIGALPVLAHLITGGGEECKKDLHLRMLAADTFHEGSPLLELAERGGMYPHHAVARLSPATQSIEDFAMTMAEKASLLIP